ncbi:hypothetical protein RHMOL_Rhmol12G0113400 [Rhododendron molle]|uniref:Uncharacterized protein n=1 Tax=Rhododendron molle TaxID=49168 RepID=A0ACC0LH47_RHOML|nr:hypothetical protein RHMOL_Rhmol12G0113400 [Rhododendron molle]
MVSMTSLCGEVYTISTNKREGNVHSLLRRVNKIALPSHSLPLLTDQHQKDLTPPGFIDLNLSLYLPHTDHTHAPTKSTFNLSDQR